MELEKSTCLISGYTTKQQSSRQYGTGKALSTINHSSLLYDPPPRVMEIKTKINKWDLLKLKIFCTGKEKYFFLNKTDLKNLIFQIF